MRIPGAAPALRREPAVAKGVGLKSKKDVTIGRADGVDDFGRRYGSNEVAHDV
jgi:hypothetical protein